MSRSYKKTPRCGDTKDKFYKKYANKQFRKDKFNNLQHNAYKKQSCSWDICDYETVGLTFEEYWKQTLQLWYQFGLENEPYPSKEEEYRKWFKWYKMK